MSIPPRTDHPRKHHYEFAHRFLPILLHKPLAERVRQAGPWVVPRFLDDMLLAIWDDVGDPLPAEERIEPEGLRAVHDPGPPEMTLVVMPPARHMVEAHFAAIIVRDTAIRYFVLEESWAPDRADATVIGEWTDDHSHVNYGPGPAPDLLAFRNAIQLLVAHID